ncbi:MAG: tRNA/rRNA methyltransferase (SpoU), partial [Bacteroidetes bacterium]|nr:tRNA/rRNA methyltransferase (SpoU) [Bacteroidota bacterium]
YRTMRRPVEHEKIGIFVAEGEKVVRRLVASNLVIVSAFMTDEWLEQYQPLLKGRQEIPVYVAAKTLLESIVGFELHQGIMAVGKTPKPPTLGEVLKSVPRPYFFAAVDGLTNSENLGVIVRNCAAFGIQALLVGETSSSPYLRRAVRNSMGAIFSLPVVPCTDLSAQLRELRSANDLRVIAAHPAGDGRLAQTDLKGNLCFVFGSEGNGVSKKVLEACSDRVSIPMEQGVDSLNVASASAAFLFEAVRQRSDAS